MRVRGSVAETGSRVAGPIDKLTRRVNRHTAGVRVMRSREVRVVCRMWQVGMRVCRHCEWITLVIHLHFHSKSASDYLQHWISIHLPPYNPLTPQTKLHHEFDVSPSLPPTSVSINTCCLSHFQCSSSLLLYSDRRYPLHDRFFHFVSSPRQSLSTTSCRLTVTYVSACFVNTPCFRKNVKLQ